MDNRAIGVFDSGLGGLTAVRKLLEILPNEDIIYFGDTGRVPYGTRGNDTIIKYAMQDIAFLKSQNIKIVIVACGTVSSVALENISLDIPIIGVIEPAVLKAVSLTKNGKIGVIGTSATIKSLSYQKNISKLNENISVFSKACPLFVPLVENGRYSPSDIVIKTVVKEYLEDLKNEGIDTLILGCTHYPLLSEVIKEYMGENVNLVNPGEQAASFTLKILEKNNMLSNKKPGKTSYFVSDDPEGFSSLGSIFLNKNIKTVVKQIDITTY